MKKILIVSALVLILLPLGAVYHKIGDFTTLSYAQDLDVVGNIAYVAEDEAGMQIIDISDPQDPVLLGSYNSPSMYTWSFSVTVVDSLAYLTENAWISRLKIIDVSDPENPSLLCSLTTPGSCNYVTVVDTLVYVADGYNHGLRIINVSDLEHPTTVGSVLTPGQAVSVAVDGDIAYVADGYAGVSIIDVSDPVSPVLLGTYNWGWVSSVTVKNSIAYVASYALTIADVSDPLNPVILCNYETPGEPYSSVVEDSTAYIADQEAGILVLDIADPQNPMLIGTYDTPGVAQYLKVINNVAYVADTSSGLQIIDIADPQNPALLVHDNTGVIAQCVVDENNIAYVAGNAGLDILDVSDPLNPILLGSCGVDGYECSMTIEDDFAYVSGVGQENGALTIIDISDLQNPTPIGYYSGWITSSTVAEGIAYLISHYNGPKNPATWVDIVDVSAPENPAHIVSFNTPGESISLTIVDGIAYVADGSAGLTSVDVTTPGNPLLLSTCDTPGNAQFVTVADSIAYVEDGNGGVRIIDVGDPSQPFLISSVSPSHLSSDFVRCRVYDNKLYISDSCWNEIIVYDVSTPQIPILIKNYAWNLCTEDLCIADNYLYAANGYHGLNILNLTAVPVDDATETPLPTYEIRNYPNPFNPETTISYILSSAGSVSLEIFNSRGQLIRSLIQEEQSAGEHTLIWNSRDDSDHSVASGLYLCRIACNGKHETRKMLLLK
jgi:hypothetical protein